jgi:hypothetical protein
MYMDSELKPLPDPLIGKWQRPGQGEDDATAEFTRDGKFISSHVYGQVSDIYTFRRLSGDRIETVYDGGNPVLEVDSVAVDGDNLTLTSPSRTVWRYCRIR